MNCSWSRFWDNRWISRCVDGPHGNNEYNYSVYRVDRWNTEPMRGFANDLTSALNYREMCEHDDPTEGREYVIVLEDELGHWSNIVDHDSACAWLKEHCTA